MRSARLTGVLLAHLLQRLLLVSEALAVVVLAAGEVVAEGLLVEVRVERRRGRGRRGRIAPNGGRRAAPPTCAARAVGGRRRGEQRGAERRGDGRHRRGRARGESWWRRGAQWRRALAAGELGAAAKRTANGIAGVGRHGTRFSYLPPRLSPSRALVNGVP